MMMILQHDGVVVDAAGSRQGFAKRKGKGEVDEDPAARRRGGGCRASQKQGFAETTRERRNGGRWRRQGLV